MTEVLRTVGLSVNYGGVRALSDVDLVVEERQLVGLIGPNGAGKTTFVDATGGCIKSTGQVLLGGEDISALASHRRARRGLTRTWQGADLFDDLSVRENLLVATGTHGWRQTLKEIATGRNYGVEQIDAALEWVGLEHVADRAADALTQGERKLVGVARALVGKPSFVCLDEPAAGLDTNESRDLGRRLRSVVDRGTSMLLVDHDMGLVLSVCDQVFVLNFGQVIARGTPAEIRSDERVVEAYLGHGRSGVGAEVIAEQAPR